MNFISADDKKWIDETWEKLDKKLSLVAVKNRDKIPYIARDGVYDDRTGKISWWTNGFWSGLLWIMYEATKNDDYKMSAMIAEDKLDGALFNYDVLDHDAGFMWHLSAGASYRLTGDLKSRNRNLLAAASLASRFNIDGRYIRAWNGEEMTGRTIIDCMMNLPLLYWASDEIKDERFKKIAMAHADMVLRDHLRCDGSIIHVVEHDINTGEKLCTMGGQGYADGSSWSRGQSWGLYGFIISYIHTGCERYLNAAKSVANYFISCVQNDGWLPKCDFRAPSEPLIYDSTAGACAACGLIEISKNVPEGEKALYLNAALNILKAMEREFCSWSADDEYILGMGTAAYNTDADYPMRHLPIIYGDFFFAEAISKLRGSKFFIW